MRAAVEVRGLTKVYGESRALDGVDLTVEEGSVFGFLGPNGAGKTTTLRILTGLAQPTSGRVRILDRDVSGADDEVRQRIGFLPDVPGFYDWMTAPEFLRFAGGLFGLSGDKLEERVAVLLDLAGLTDVATRIGGYSRGMKQRLGVAQALVNAPKLLMLDEPTSALDPMGRKEVLEMLASLRGRTTVLFSTHILADVERICDTVAILDHGKVVAAGAMDEIKQRYGSQRIVLEVTEREEEVAAAIAGRPWASSVTRDDDGSIQVSVSDIARARLEVPALVSERGIGLKRMEAGEIGLEEVFVDLVGGGKR
jgi:ABC-2 type transport system ATP-binding protein